MELTLEGVTSMEAGGNVTIELPAYMHVLDKHEFQLARASADKLERILAAGRHPTSGNMVFITGAGDIREIDFTEVFKTFEAVVCSSISCNDYVPIVEGRSVRVDFNELDIMRPIELDADWCIQQSQLMIALGAAFAGKNGVRVTYLDDEVDPTPAALFDT
jgi:hypothetical protein